MMIKNKRELIANGATSLDQKAREYALTILEEGLNAVDPYRAIHTNLIIRGEKLSINNLSFDLSKFKRIYVLGAGKASGAMAEAIEEILGDRITQGFINVNRGAPVTSSKTGRIIINEASHPIPDESGLRGAEKILEIANGAAKEDLVFYLISGGGSALAPLPAEGITLKNKMAVTSLLLKVGATINELNAVRKHISAIKGGRLAKAVYPATLIGLIISDVVGDHLDVISSGPTTPDSSTYPQARENLEKYGLWKEIPESVRKYLEEGCREEIPETPKDGNEAFEKTYNVIVGSSRLAMVKMQEKATSLGLNPLILSTRIEGEAREVGKVLASIALEAKLSDNPMKKPAAIIGGGETTVTVKGKGTGGRNQELALGAAPKLKDIQGVAMVSIGSDGIDGPTDAAGALTDETTSRKATEMNLKPYEYLKENDSYNFFKKIGDLVLTGATGTNVNDLMVMIIL